MLNPADWPAIAAAQARDASARLPFFIDDGGTACLVGSVARAHLAALARWPQALQVGDGALTLTLPAIERSPFFTQANRRLHQDGLVIGWRDETYPVLAQHDGRLLAGHKALTEPAEIDASQLQRWLLRQLREQVAA